VRLDISPVRLFCPLTATSMGVMIIPAFVTFRLANKIPKFLSFINIIKANGTGLLVEN